MDIDKNGRLIAIEQRWEFDEFVSAILLESMDTIVPGNPPMATLADESQRMVKDLAPFHYYSHLSINGKKTKITAPASHYLKAIKTNLSENGTPRPPVNLLSLIMRFEFPEPLPVENNTLQLEVYDPTYYAAFSFTSNSSTQNSNPQCKRQITLPKPNDAMIAYAFSLDKNQRDTGGLGANFAERLTLNCGRTESINYTP